MRTIIVKESVHGNVSTNAEYALRMAEAVQFRQKRDGETVSTTKEALFDFLAEKSEELKKSVINSVFQSHNRWQGMASKEDVCIDASSIKLDTNHLLVGGFDTLAARIIPTKYGRVMKLAGDNVSMSGFCEKAPNKGLWEYEDVESYWFMRPKGGFSGVDRSSAILREVLEYKFELVKTHVTLPRKEDFVKA